MAKGSFEVLNKPFRDLQCHPAVQYTIIILKLSRKETNSPFLEHFHDIL